MAFPEGFKVPKDQGGPGQDKDVGGFGGNPDKSQDEHKAAVRSVGKAPVILLHGNAAAADSTDWNMLKLKQMLMGAGYPEEVIWAPSYLGGPYPPTGNGTADKELPHTNNVNEVREFIENVCKYLDVDVVDFIAHSLGCTLAYAVFRGLRKQNSPVVFDEPKNWNRVGTFVALAGAFHGFGEFSPFAVGEWKTSSDFMRHLLKEELAGGNDETPFSEGQLKTPDPAPHHNVKYFCGIASGDFVDFTKPGTGKLNGAINLVRNEGSDLFGNHRLIKEDPTVFKAFLPHLNSVPPISPVTITTDKVNGAYDAPLEITVNLDSPDDTTVSCTARRVTKEVQGGFFVVNTAETVEETLNSQQKLTLSTEGMWEVVFSAEGTEDVKRTYWVGIPLTLVTITTDNSVPFDRSLVVMATTNSTKAKLFYSIDSAQHSVNSNRMWIEGASATISDNAEVHFVALNPDGTTSEEISRLFRKQVKFQDAVTANANEHFIAGRVNLNEYLTYFGQFHLKPFTLYLVNGSWVLDPNQPTESTRPPVPEVSHPSGTHTEPITVTLTARDEADPSSKIYYTTDGSKPTTNAPFFVGSGQLTFDTTGTKTLQYFAQNSAGNSSDIKTEAYEMDVPDAQPVIRVKDDSSQPGGYSNGLTVDIEAVDDRDEHLTVHYTLDGSIPDESYPNFRDSMQFEILEQGNHAITCYARDSAGNESYRTFWYSIG